MTRLLVDWGLPLVLLVTCLVVAWPIVLAVVNYWAALLVVLGAQP